MQGRDHRSLRISLDMPAKRRDPCGRPLQMPPRHRRIALAGRFQIDPHAAHAGFMHISEHCVGRGLVDHRDAARAFSQHAQARRATPRCRRHKATDARSPRGRYCSAACKAIKLVNRSRARRIGRAAAKTESVRPARTHGRGSRRHRAARRNSAACGSRHESSAWHSVSLDLVHLIGLLGRGRQAETECRCRSKSCAHPSRRTPPPASAGSPARRRRHVCRVCGRLRWCGHKPRALSDARIGRPSPRLASMSLTPIITMSTPSTATISSARSMASADSNCTITMVASLSAAMSFRRRKAAVLQMRERQAGAALAERRKFRRLDHRARFLGRADARRDDAERAAVEHPRDIVRGVAGHANESRDAGAQSRQADLPGGLDREAGVLHVDIEHVETGGLGDSARSRRRAPAARSSRPPPRPGRACP